MTVLSILDLRVALDALEQAPALIHETLAGTRARPGCLGVDVTVDVDDPTHFLFVEKWESLEHDDAYRAWRLTPEGAAVLNPIVAGPPTLTRTVLREEI
ncbi:putative quinol monooxygenase [Herbiconiux sp. P15]|uniref:putative quinol monooxygenase n=1 Tax=Herbiconiux liukaitaii TaxID=3342799 RepID=UPI0035B6B383